MTDSSSDILSKLDVLEKNIQEIRSELTKSTQDIRVDLAKANQDIQVLSLAQKSTQEEILHVVNAAEVASKLNNINMLPITKPKSVNEPPVSRNEPIIYIESPENKFLNKYLRNVAIQGPAKTIREYFAIICPKINIELLADNADDKEIEEHGKAVYNHIMSATEEKYKSLKDFIVALSK